MFFFFYTPQEAHKQTNRQTDKQSQTHRHNSNQNNTKDKLQETVSYENKEKKREIM